jgi:hypothetical protein
MHSWFFSSFGLFFAVLLIRIGFNAAPNPDPAFNILFRIQGFDDQKLKKFTTEKSYNFLIKN